MRVALFALALGQASAWNCAEADRYDWVADGYCDDTNNKFPCFDGGDCCEDTCLDIVQAGKFRNEFTEEGGVTYDCGENGYKCLDPCHESAKAHLSSNGKCANSNNFAPCWDGGDCCKKTCKKLCNDQECEYSCGSNGYDCKDKCVDAPKPWLQGNGRCADNNNIAPCWDGGDCCASTCIDGPEWTCGDEGYDCRDDGSDGGDCEDDSGWYYKGKSSKDCDWVGKDSSERCKGKYKSQGKVKSRDACKETCGECSTCEDSTSWFYENVDQPCDWVRKDRDERCKGKYKDPEGVKAKDGCPSSCDNCED